MTYQTQKLRTNDLAIMLRDQVPFVRAAGDPEEVPKE